MAIAGNKTVFFPNILFLEISAASSSNLKIQSGSTDTITFSGANATFSGTINVDDTTEATTTTDGSLQTDGGLSVVKDVIFGNDLKLLSDSAVLSLGVDSDFSLTHDGTTGGTITGNPLTLDSGGDINFDSV